MANYLDKYAELTVSPEYTERARKFQRIFSVYFPYLEADWHQAALEMEWIWYGIMNNQIQTVRKQSARRELEKLVSTIRRLSKSGVPYWEDVSRGIMDEEATEEQAAVRFEEAFGRAMPNRYFSVAGYQRAILDFLLSIDEMEGEGLTNEVLRKFTEKATHGIDRLPERRNINWDAVEAVSRLRVLWWRNTDSEAPSRALNPASTFCRFLADGFAFLEIDADPVSAFKRWVEAYPHK
jgi:hypothetical protein